MRSLIFILSVGSCIFFGSLGAFAQVVATVDGETITLSELNAQYQQALKTPLAANIRPTKKQILQDLIRYKLGLKLAKKQGIENDKAFKEKVRQELYKAFLERNLAKKVEAIKVTKNDMKAYNEKRPQIRTSHILIRIPIDATPSQMEEIKKRVSSIYKKVIGSKRPFSELAKIYSEDEITKPFGGDIGYQSSITIHPSYYRAALKLKKGQISKPVRSRFGFHIIYKHDTRSYELANKEYLRIAVFEEKRKNVFDRFFKKELNKVSVSINENLIK